MTFLFSRGYPTLARNLFRELYTEDELCSSSLCGRKTLTQREDEEDDDDKVMQGIDVRRRETIIGGIM